MTDEEFADSLRTVHEDGSSTLNLDNTSGVIVLTHDENGYANVFALAGKHAEESLLDFMDLLINTASYAVQGGAEDIADVVYGPEAEGVERIVH